MSEAHLHRAVVQLLEISARAEIVWYHVPNGEQRSPITGARLRSMGVKPGVADLAFVLDGGRAAFLELKFGTGRLSPEQKHFRDRCTQAGADHAVAYRLDEAVEHLRAWGVLRNSNTSAAAGRGAETGAAVVDGPRLISSGSRIDRAGHHPASELESNTNTEAPGVPA